MITSKQNPKIEQVRALLSRRRERYKLKRFVLEGVRLVEDALHSGSQPELLLYSETLSPRGQQTVRTCQENGIEIDEISQNLMDWISDTKTSQGLLAVFSMVNKPLPHNLHFVLILDTIRDPGNLGTILRGAAAAGVQVVLLTPGTTDVYAPKVLRAGMGAHFQLAVQYMDWPQIRPLLEGAGSGHITTLLAAVEGGKPLWEIDLRKPLGLIIGSEASGVSQAANEIADTIITIPMPGERESLNAAMAASIILFEIVRQRRS